VDSEFDACQSCVHCFSLAILSLVSWSYFVKLGTTYLFRRVLKHRVNQTLFVVSTLHMICFVTCFVILSAADELIERFRPNLVVKTSVAFEEETWSTIMIGDNIFKVGELHTCCRLDIIYVCLSSLSCLGGGRYRNNYHMCTIIEYVSCCY